MFRWSTVVLAGVALAVTFPLTAAGPGDESPRAVPIQRVGAWPYGPTLAVDTDSGRELVFASLGGVVAVLDVTDTGDVQTVSDSIHTHGLVEDLFYVAADQRLFVAAGEGGLEIWDLAVPAAPQLLSRTEVLYFGFETPVGGVEVYEDVAVVECSWGYVRSLDVSDPTNPVQVGGEGGMGNPAHRIHISQADGQVHSTGAQRYQRSRILPSGHLDSSGMYDFDFGSYEVFGTPDVAYVGYGEALWILDLLIPGFLPWSITGVGGVHGIEVEEGIAYFYNTNRLRIFDVTVHNSPVHVSSITGEIRYTDLVHDPGRVTLGGGFAGVQLVDVSNLALPMVAGGWDEAYVGSFTTALSDTHAFVANSGDGLLAIDLADPTSPVLAGRFATGGEARDVALVGTLAWVAALEGGLYAIDVSDPSQPSLFGQLAGLSAWRVAPVGDLAYVIEAIPNEPYALHVVDITDPSQPVPLGQQPLPTLSWELQVDGSHLYVAAHDGGVRIFDLTAPAVPVQVATIPLPSVTDLAVRDGVMYVAAHENAGGGFFTYDVDDPAQPSLLAAVTPDGFAPFHLELEGDYVYLTEGGDLSVFLVTDPASPADLGRYRLPGDQFDVVARNGTVFVSDGQAGLQIVENNLFGDPSGGLDWTPLPSGTSETLNDVAFTSVDRGFVVGAGGTVLETSDGGDTWAPKAVPASGTLLGIDFSDADHGWIVGAAGRILTTSDGGATWTAQSSGTGATLEAVDFVDADTGWATGANGIVLHTSDGGVTWAPQTSGTANTLGSVSFADSSIGWAAMGAFGTLLHTSDGGATWSPVDTGSAEILFAVDFADAVHGVAVGTFGEIVTTADGGATWSFPQSPHPPAWLYDVFAMDDAHGWAVGFDGHVATSLGAAGPWIADDTGVHEQLNGVFFLDLSHGWAVGDDGRILRLAASSPTPIFADGFESGDMTSWSSATP